MRQGRAEAKSPTRVSRADLVSPRGAGRLHHGPMRRLLLSSMAAGLLGCVGSIGEGGDLPPGVVATVEPAPGPPARPSPAAAPLPDGVGRRPLLRLTPFEYQNTVRDLLGVTPPPQNLEAEAGEHGFEFAADVTPVDAASLQERAEEIAALAVARRIAALVPCNPAQGDAACARAFIAAFGRRAFRRPLLPAEQTNLEALYAAARTSLGYDFTQSVRVLIAAVLQAPQFVYHWEATGPAIRAGGAVALGPYELASRLSYLLWASTPDDELLDKAQSGALATPAGLAAQARRMLASPKARAAIVDMVARQWLGLDKVKGVAKTLPDVFSNSRTGPAMAAEAARFVGHVLFDSDGRLATLLTAPYTFANEDLAKIYGVPVAGRDLQRIELDPARRAGLLTQGSFLAYHAGAAETSPVKRGKAIADALLCLRLPDPPADVPPLPPAGATARTMRARTEQHATDPACAACHRFLDPLGFGLEHYDAAGRYRTIDNGQPIDARGTVVVGESERAFWNGVELAALLAGAPEVEECATRHVVRYLLGRAELPDEAASVQEAREALAAANGSLPELLVALTQTRVFRFRAPSPGEDPR